MRKSPEVTKYLKALPLDKCKALEVVREMIHKSVPGIEETISYKIPCFKYFGKGLVSISASQKHLSLHIMSPLVAKKLNNDAGCFSLCGATIHFQPEKVITQALLNKVLKLRKEEITAMSQGLKSPKVDDFFKKTKQWQIEMTEVRTLLLKMELKEEFKWRLPCYSHEGNNILIIQPFKGCLGVMFFKGALLKDSKNLLVDNGPNSQAGRRFEFKSIAQIKKIAPTIRSYVREAIKIENSGQKVEFKKTPEPIPSELKALFKAKPRVKKAFEALTPGRQRAYILHFSSAKQSSTRTSRIKKCIPLILEGKGIHGL